eukprot:4232401-Prymnesium_polylepis.1
MQPVQEDIMALLNHHGLVGDGRRPCPHAVQRPHRRGLRSPTCAAELKICPTIPTVVKHGTVGTATSTIRPPFHVSLYTTP